MMKMMMEMGLDENAAAAATQPPPLPLVLPPLISVKPISKNSNTTASSWLLTTLADLEEKMKLVHIAEEQGHNHGGGGGGDGGDTLAQRAESYYTQRPRLLALLHHLHHSYLSLAHRYSHSLSSKQQHNPITKTYNSTFQFDINHFYQQPEEEEDGYGSDIDDAKSSLSYQQTTTTATTAPPQMLDTSIIITELVMKQVECHLMAHDMGLTEKRLGEWMRKIDLQKSLLEVLESERLVLLNENARLGYKVGTLVQENKGLATESILIKRKAVQLATCVLKMRDDERVSMMSRKIQHLKGQINKLEKRNQEYYDELVKVKTVDQTPNVSAAVASDKMKVSKWWDKFKKIDLFLCYTSNA